MASFKFRVSTGSKLLLVVGGSIAILIVFLMTFLETPAASPGSIFGELALKEPPGNSSTQKRSNYQSIKAGQPQAGKSTLRYKERKTEANPFFSFYREPKSLAKPKQAPLKQVQAPKQETGFFTATNSDVQAAKSFFEAVFREQQHVEDGKALRIVLKEAIPSLELAAGTILKGVPYLAGGSRLKIKLSAAVTEEKVLQIALLCFDKEDCLEGLYHDELAAQLAEATQTGLLEAAFDLALGEGAIARQGEGIACKFSALARGNKPIIIERGREVLVAVPKQPVTID